MGGGNKSVQTWRRERLLIPPDAEPVIPASVVMLIASLSRSGMAASAFDSTRKPGRAAITAPKPYSDAVFMAREDRTANRRSAPFRRATFNVAIAEEHHQPGIPEISAASTAQIAVILPTSVVIGLARPGSSS